MSETRVPAIPAVTSSNLTDVAKAIKQVLDVREGLVGDSLDANVTFRDLIASGLATASVGGARGSMPIVPPGSSQTDLTQPPAPENFTATGAFAVVQLKWDEPGYANHAYAEVWRSSTNVLGNALLVGTTTTRFYVDSLGTSGGAYYWVRFVSRADVIGPYNGLDGTHAQTANNPALVLASLTGQITESQLYTSLADRISLIDADSTVAGSVAKRLADEAKARAAAIEAEVTARDAAINYEAGQRTKAIETEALARTGAISSATATLQSQINLLAASSSGDLNQLIAAVKTESESRQAADETFARNETLLLAINHSNTAAIKSEESARSTADSAQASAMNLLYVKSGDSTAAILNEAEARTTAQSAIASEMLGLRAATGNNAAGLAAEQQVRTDAQSALASLSNALTSSTGSAHAAILEESKTRTQADSATASQSLALASSIGANSSAIQIEQSTRASETGSLSTQVATISAGTGSISAGIKTEQDARTSETSALASQVSNLSAIAGSSSAALTTTQKTTADQVSALASQITGMTSMIGSTTSSLQVEQTTRSSETSALSTQITRALAKSDDGTAALVVEQTARVNADSVFSGQIASFAAVFGNSTATLVSEQSARATADSATASQITGLNTASGTNASAISQEAISRASATGVLSSIISKLSAATGSAYAAIKTEEQSRIDSGSATSNVIQTLQSTVNGHTSLIQTESTVRASETGSLFAKYGVKTDVAGHVAGFGLLSTANNSEPTSSFGVRADQFFVAPASNTSSTAPTTGLYNGYVWVDTSVIPAVTRYYNAATMTWSNTPTSLPFVVQSAPLTLSDGTVIQQGVYINSAFIVDGTITNAKIKNLAVDDAKIASLDAAKITTGYLDADRIEATSITADKIDTRGLLIKDSSGKVIFGSGNYGAGVFSTPPTKTTSDGPINYSSAGSALPSGVNSTYFYARWEGYIRPLESGQYVIGVGSDDGCNLFVGGKQLINNLSSGQAWGGNLTYSQWGAIDLEAGVYYPIVIEWQQGAVASALQLLWTIPFSGSVQLVSGDFLSTSNTTVNGKLTGRWWNGDSTLWYPSGAMPKLTAANASTYIADAAIGNAQIGNYIASLAFNGTIDAAGAITNNGTAGWAISKAGQAVLNNAVVRGDVQATSLNAATGTFTGTLQAANGTFTGTLQGATGTFSGELSAGTIDISKLIGQTTTYTTPGTYNITVPSGFTSMRVLLIGGGGGGATSYGNSHESANGGGGGGGGVSIATYSNLAAGQTIAVTVGAGGAGGPERLSDYGGGNPYYNGQPGGSSAVYFYSGAYPELVAHGGNPGLQTWQNGPTRPGTGGAGTTANGYDGVDSYGGDSGLHYGIGGTPGAYTGYYNIESTRGQPGSAPGGGGAGGLTWYIFYGGAAGRGGDGKAVIEFYNPNGVIVRSEWNTLMSALQRQGIAIT